MLMVFCLIKPHSVGRYFVLGVSCTGFTLASGNNLLFLPVELTYQFPLHMVMELIFCFINHVYFICTSAITYHNNMQARLRLIP